MPPLYYSARRALLELYPQVGPSTIVIGPTGGIPIQLFGNFLGQTGPDRIDGADADAPVYITGSLGNDTIIDGPRAGFIEGGGGSDMITSRDDVSDQVECSPGSASTVFADTLDTVTSSCPTVHRAKPVLPLRGLSFSPSRAKYSSSLTLIVPIYAAGTLQLSFERASCARAHACKRYTAEGAVKVKLKPGLSSVRVNPKARVGHRLQRLPRGAYRVAARLSSRGLKSPRVDLPLVIR
jgi:hypothetical protein